MQPYIEQLSQDVVLKWGCVEGRDGSSFFIPESGPTPQLSSLKGNLLWPWKLKPDPLKYPRDDQFYLLSSGNFLYVKGNYREWSTDTTASEVYIGEPMEAPDPSQLPYEKLRETSSWGYTMRLDKHRVYNDIGSNITNAVSQILAAIGDIDEDSFNLLMSFPQVFSLIVAAQIQLWQDGETDIGCVICWLRRSMKAKTDMTAYGQLMPSTKLPIEKQ